MNGIQSLGSSVVKDLSLLSLSIFYFQFPYLHFQTFYFEINFSRSVTHHSGGPIVVLTHHENSIIT